MTYDKKGIGISEMMQVSFYFPSVFKTVEGLIEENQALALQIVRKTIDAYNMGMIDKENS